jgi:DNA-binding helix-hairpin-helix protein with protein kinase domain
MSKRSQELMIRLGESLGQNIGMSKQRTFEQSAVDFFKDKDITPDTINQFSSMHPNVPLQNIYQYASGIGQIKERQEVNDLGMNLINADMAGQFKGEKDVVEFLQNAKASNTSKQKAVQAYLQFKQTNANIFKKEGITLKENERYGVVEGGQFKEIATGIGKPVKLSRINPETGNIESMDVAPDKVADHLNSGWQQGEIKEAKDDATADLRRFEKVENFTKEQRGTPEYRKAYYEFLKAGKQAITVDTGEKDKTKQITADAKTTLDKLVKKDIEDNGEPSEVTKKVAETYGLEIVKTPDKPDTKYLIHPSLSWGGKKGQWSLVPKVSTKQTIATQKDKSTALFKTADDVKSAYSAGKITKENAANILRTQFGYK